LQQSVRKIDSWCDAGDIKRHWNFTGGGIHGFISTRGPSGKIDDAHRWITKETGAHLDSGCYHNATFHRIVGSKNTNHGNFIIPVEVKEVCTMSQNELIGLAKTKRSGKITYGTGAWYFGEVEIEPSQEVVALGDYSREVKTMKIEEVLDDYGLDWNLDFCPAIQGLVMKDNISNEERLQVIKYLANVVKMPFVEPGDPTKTASNLFYNILKDKDKAVHAIKAREVEAVFKKNRKFHPYKLRQLGLCQSGCADCMEKRFE